MILIMLGPPGCGKLSATERAARAVGMQARIVDRAQGPVDYTRWGCNSFILMMKK